MFWSIWSGIFQLSKLQFQRLPGLGIGPRLQFDRCRLLYEFYQYSCGEEKKNKNQRTFDQVCRNALITCVANP
jgi:hypothetical protein